MRQPTEAETLQTAAVIVAAPRYMGAFAAAIGIMIVDYYWWFPHLEIWSGAAMALLEGWAIAFVFRQWRAMQIKSLHWWVLLILQLSLMLILPVVAAPYLVSSQLGEPVKMIISAPALWLWSLLVAAIAPLVLAAVGYADARPAEVNKKSKIKSGQGATESGQGATESGQGATESEQKPQTVLKVPASAMIMCEYCNRTFGTQQGLNAHRRHCANSANELVALDTSSNGNK